MLKDMPSGIFTSGQFLYDGGMKKWVATRGTIHDWAIYYGEVYDTEQHIKDWGTKLHDMPQVKFLVNADEEAYKMYRH